ncbi:unnamed protein product [Clonostachys rhizophaga]|uniref:mitogen-activated protein kinase n=1 Tax=Clonostachys rhizophaga TaxID=160324 RepID=A0A9N9W3X3_9HYPO|nr:unnamed protein product [Clonostachys rhizophaga]
MPRDGPHPYALFSLLPANPRAKKALEHPENAHLVSDISSDAHSPEIYALDVGLHIGSASRYTLATIGRLGNIVVEGAGISRIQCSFEFHETNQREIMLHDRSNNNTTQLHGHTALPFEAGRIPRRVIIDPTVNLLLGFGGASCDMYKFEIVWHRREHLNVPKLIRYRENNPRLARTVLDEGAPTVAPSGRVTRIHTPASNNRVQIRYSARKFLGSGGFGEVHSVINVDTGNLLAMKRVRCPPPDSNEYILLKREVHTLSKVSHRHIIKCLCSRQEGEELLIFMDLKPGNVEQLISRNVFVEDPPLAKPLLHQMLQALDYLSHHGIIHRDVKPENILYDSALSLGQEGKYEYQLADFGLSNLATDACTRVGTSLYMAPELDIRNGPQTTKVDVWSLFVTLAYALDEGGFQRKLRRTAPPLRMITVREAANEERLRDIRAMAEIDPDRRASAAEILDQVFRGEGRTTPRRAVDVHGTRPGPEMGLQGPAGPVAGAEMQAGGREQRRGRPPRDLVGIGARATRPATRATQQQFVVAETPVRATRPATRATQRQFVVAETPARAGDVTQLLPGAFPDDDESSID